MQRLNISLDSLQPETFARITRGGDLARVLAGIAAAERAGFPIKINMVVMRGINDHEVADFAALTLDKPFTVRFIEYMPAIQEEDWQSLLVPGEILDRLGQRFTVSPGGAGELAGPAKEFRIAGAAGTIGVITPVSGHFCGDCNRIRVTSSGMAKQLPLRREALDLKPILATVAPMHVGALRSRDCKPAACQRTVAGPTPLPCS